MYAAYARRASEEELDALGVGKTLHVGVSRARADGGGEGIRPHRRRGATERARRYAAGAERVRSILDRAFDADTVDEQKYLAILRDYRVELDRDERRGASYAFERRRTRRSSTRRSVHRTRRQRRVSRELIAACDLVFEIIAERDRSSTRPR